MIVMTFDYSSIFVSADWGVLYNPELWEGTHQDLIAALSKCAATVEKEAEKATLEYIKECASIDVRAAVMYGHLLLSTLLTPARSHLSLFLQVSLLEGE